MRTYHRDIDFILPLRQEMHRNKYKLDFIFQMLLFDLQVQMLGKGGRRETAAAADSYTDHTIPLCI
jgi:hypothetical protein